MKNISKNNTRVTPTRVGFTIIELLVVVAIIALLTGIIMTNLTGSKAKARDAKRISDLGQIQMALELYFDRCKQYPLPTDSSHLLKLTTDLSNGCTSGIDFKTFLSTVPTPPPPFMLNYNHSTLDNFEYYIYIPGPQQNPSAPSQYILMTPLETNNVVLSDDVDENSKPKGWARYYGTLCNDVESSSNPKYGYCISSN